MRGRHRAQRTLVAALAAAVALCARGEEWSGRADLTYSDERAATTSDQFLRQRYELLFRHPISEALTYSLSVRYQEDHGRTAFDGGAERLVSRAVEGRGDVSWNRERYGFTTRYELDYTGDFRVLDLGGADRRLQHASVSGYYRPAAPLTITSGFDHLESASRAGSSTDDRVDLSALYDGSGFRIVESNRIQRTDERTADRLTYGPRLDVSFQRQLGKDASFGAQYSGDYMRTDVRSLLGTAASVAFEVTPVAALYVKDDLPLDTAATPMQPDPALIDRNLFGNAGIVIGGPDGSSFQNVGLDMGRVVEVDSFRVTVRSSTGNLLSFGGPVAWTGYWSNDGVRWTPTGGDVTVFDDALSAYQVEFSPTRARFFKVVNFGTNTLDTSVTEVQAFYHQVVQHQTSDALLQAVGASAAAKPWEKLALNYSGLFNATGATSEGTGRVWARDSTHSVGATIGPFGPFSLQLGHNRWDAWFPGTPIQGSASTSAAVQWRPLPQLDAGLTLTNGEARTSGLAATTNAAGIRGGVRLYDTVRFGTSADYSRQVLAGSGGTTDFMTASAMAGVKPRTELDVTLSTQLQRTVSKAGDVSPVEGVPLLQVVQYDRYQLEARYRPAPQLDLDVRTGYARAQGGSGFLQQYRILWNPLRGGAVQAGIDYEEDIDPLSGRSFRRVNGLSRWNLNRQMSLQLTYNRTRGAEGDRRDMVYLSFGLRT